MRRSIRPFLLVVAAAALAAPFAPAAAEDPVAAAEKAFENADWHERMNVFDSLDSLKPSAKVLTLAAKGLKDDDWGVQIRAAKTPRDRMIFAADNLGLSLEQIRKVRKDGGFEGQVNQEAMKQIASDYSMFRLIVNVVREKSEWVENL